jgi:hypothetical protein
MISTSLIPLNSNSFSIRKAWLLPFVNNDAVAILKYLGICSDDVYAKDKQLL